MLNNTFYRLQGVIQHYAWGGYDFLPRLLSNENTAQQPFAEYWLGTHPKGTARVSVGDEFINLQDFIDSTPDKMLGPTVNDEFGELPFLFKILDVNDMLSIQLHPTKTVAEEGFAAEEAAGIPRLAPHRNYKDLNHKPELMVALSDFWLLHGFRQEQEIAQTLQEISAWQPLVDILEEVGVRGLYKYIMEAEQSLINILLSPLQEQLSSLVIMDKNSPAYWAQRAFKRYSKDGQHDRGIFSIYWFNIVYLEVGEAIFQAAGIPHAYLEGQNIELMANSDNVLRGGLTPKHIDVPELLANIRTDAIIPEVVRGKQLHGAIQHFPVPVPDFALATLTLSSGEQEQLSALGPAIVLVVSGEVQAEQELFTKGSAFFLPYEQSVVIQQQGAKAAQVFIAYCQP